METPATKLGVDDEVLDPTKPLATFASLQEEKAGRKPEDAAWLAGSVVQTLCAVYYLRGDWQEVQRWGAEMANVVEYYLFGDWRESALTDEGLVDPEWWFKTLGSTWTHQMAHALCWSSVLSLWDHIDKLLTFPSEEVKKDLQGAAPRAFYIGLAKWWRDHADLSGLEDAKKIRGAGSKDFHMRCDVLTAISSGDAAMVQKSFIAYLKFWVKRVKRWPQDLALGPTFVWHVARREGFVVDLPDELSIHVIVLPDEGRS
jgi:hypothetical protein